MRRIAEELTLVAQLRLRSVPERLDAPKHDTDLGMGREYLPHGSVVPFGNDVVVVQKVYQNPLREGPTQVPNGARHTSGWRWIFHVVYTGVVDTCNDRLG